ncbi:transmembrane amino acid transporter protein [Ancylostoma ceylanicum]|uniref:Transmembrane amino acid transporter protein n=1 Tax=Ancylostoma ceylanicum TaxID=53326 RepID=A0A0D6LIE6_9BILA|nr:transmembrane amino acid transporter protein [Ancylostoma ceylanicum]
MDLSSASSMADRTGSQNLPFKEVACVDQMPHVSVVDFTRDGSIPKNVSHKDVDKQQKKKKKEISYSDKVEERPPRQVSPERPQQNQPNAFSLSSPCSAVNLADRPKPMKNRAVSVLRHQSVPAIPLKTGFALVFFVGLVTCICMMKLVKCSQFLTSRQPKVQSLNYAEMADESFKQSFPCLRNHGHIARRFVNLCLSSLVLGICSIYYIFVVDHTREVLVHLWPQLQISKLSCLIIAIVPFILLSFVRSIRLMSYVSMAGNIFMILSIVIIFSQLLPAPHLTAELPWFTNFRGVVLATGNVIYSFEGQALVLPLENKMKHPTEMRGWTGVLSTGISLVTIVYAACGFFGYITYGKNVKESITLNMDDG